VRLTVNCEYSHGGELTSTAHARTRPPVRAPPSPVRRYQYVAPRSDSFSPRRPLARDSCRGIPSHDKHIDDQDRFGEHYTFGNANRGGSTIDGSCHALCLASDVRKLRSPVVPHPSGHLPLFCRVRKSAKPRAAASKTSASTSAFRSCSAPARIALSRTSVLAPERRATAPS